jgi:hypothetical protein
MVEASSVVRLRTQNNGHVGWYGGLSTVKAEASVDPVDHALGRPR